MPYFDYDGDIRIDPDDYVDSCTKFEIAELIQCLVDDGHLPPSVSNVGDRTQSTPEWDFERIMTKIASSRLQLTNEEDELLRKIASRF